MIVAHDVNPILPYLDRVIYLGRGGAVSGHPGRGDHRRDAQPAVRHARSRCCPHRTGGSSWSASRRRRRTTPTGTPATAPTIAVTRVTVLFTWNLVDRPAGACGRLHVHGQRVPGRHASSPILAAAGRLVHGAAPAELRRAHAGRRRLPRRGRRGLAGRRRRRRLLRVLRRGRAGHRRACRGRGTRGYTEESGGDRHRAGVRARHRDAVRRPVPGLPQRYRTRCCSAASSASPGGQVAVLAVGRGGRPGRAGGHRPAAAVRLGGSPTPPGRTGCPPGRCGARVPGRCSGPPRPRSARSPARCWCSRCWYCHRRPPSC